MVGLSVLLAIGTGLFLSELGMLHKTLGIVLLVIGLVLIIQKDYLPTQPG